MNQIVKQLLNEDAEYSMRYGRRSIAMKNWLLLNPSSKTLSRICGEAALKYVEKRKLKGKYNEK